MTDTAARVADLGIESEYFDALGTLRIVPEATTARLSELLGHDGQPRSNLIWRRGRTRRLPILDGFRAFEWSLYRGKKELASGTAHDGAITVGEDIPPGVYSLSVSEGARWAVMNLIVAPETADQLDSPQAERKSAPFESAHFERTWVLAVQLYGVRSNRNWGHGDFTDLRNLIRSAASVGAAGIGLNPLHALFDDRPDQPSPYSPNSRLFLNPLYIDPEAIPEYPASAAAELGDQLARLRQSDRIDYTGVAAAKLPALRLAYARFREGASAKRTADFERFKRERGLSLTLFAAFETLRRRLPGVWWDWPDEWRTPTAAAAAALRLEAGDEMGYHEFVQWVADRQLAACKAEARGLGLPVGLYADIAVGVEPGGADAWAAQASILRGVEAGAPPDLLNTAGQAWGVAAFNPHALAAEAFAPFADVLDAAMRHAGAIRIDHVLGLNRMFLVPSGVSARDGAYLRYPLQALLALIALKSREHHCLVIGEDLGTVPDELRGVLADWGVWSYLVMVFERGNDGKFIPPGDYRRNALVTFGTHDLSTFEGWRTDHDLRVKRSLGLDPGEDEDDRNRARWMLGEALASADVCRDRAWTFVDIARFLARAPSRLMVVAIEDVLGVIDQPNVPGTIDEHPNWRQKLPVALEEFASHPQMRAVATALREEGRGLR